MADSVVDITIRATNEIGKTLKQVEADIRSIRRAQLSLQQSTGANQLERGFEAMSVAAGETSKTIKQVEIDIGDIKVANEALQIDAATDALSATFRDISTAANDAASGVGDLDEELHDAFEGLGDTAVGAAAGVSELGAEVSNLSVGMPKLIRFLKLAATGFLAFQSVKTAKNFADTAGRAEVLGTVLRTVAANAGIGSAAIRRMEQEVSALGITTEATRESLTKMIQSGLLTEATASRAQELARSAQDLAVTSGQDSSETFRRLIINIQQLDTVGLRYQGIIVDRIAGQKEFLRQNPQITGALSKQQQQQSLFNNVLLEAGKLTGIYELSMQNVSKRVGSLTRLHKTLSEEVGKTLLPTYSALVDVYSDFITEITAGTKAFDENEAFAVQLGAAVRHIATAIKDFILVIIEWKAVWLSLLAVFAGGLIIKALAALTATLVTLGIELYSVSLRALQAGAAVTTMANGMTLASRAVRVLGVALRLAIPLGWILLIGEALYALSLQFPIVGQVAKVAFALIGVLAASVLDTLGQVIGRIVGVVQALRVLSEGGSPTEAWQAYSAAVDDYTDNSIEAVGKLKEAWGELGEAQGGTQEELLQEGKDLISEMRAQQVALIVAKQALAKARAAASGTTSETLNKEIVRLEKEAEELDKSIKTISKKIKVITDQSFEATRDKLQDHAQDITAAGQGPLNAINAVNDKIAAAEALLFGKDFDPEKPGITAKFEGLADALSTLIKLNLTPFSQEVEGEAVNIDYSLERIVVGFERLAVATKTPRDIALALMTIAPIADEVSERIRALRESLEVRLENSTIKELDEQFAGLSARLKELKGTYGILLDVQQALNVDQSTLTGTLLRLGASLDNAKKGILGVRNEFTILHGITHAIADVSLDPLIKEFGRLTAVYITDTSALEVQTKRRKALLEEQSKDAVRKQQEAKEEINAGIGNSNELLKTLMENDRKWDAEHKRIATAVAAVDKDSLKKRTALAKAHFDSLRSLRQQSLDEYTRSVEKIAKLDEQLAALGEEEDAFNNDIRRRKLTDYQRYQDDLKQIDQLTRDQRLAFLNEDFEKAEELGRKRIDLAKSIDGAAGVNTRISEKKSIEEVSNAIEAQELIVKRQKTLTEEVAAKQLAVYKNLTVAIKQLAVEIKDIAGEQTAKILVDLDDPSLQAAYADLDAFVNEDREATVTVKVDTASLKKMSDQIKAASQSASNFPLVQRQASGGSIHGPGTETSDSIPAWLSNNEFVMKAKAVRHWGTDFMYAINNLQMPQFNMGGMVSNFLPSFMPSFAPVYQPAFAGGGVVSAPAQDKGQGKGMDVVEIRLKTEKEEATLMAERRNMQGFVNILQNIEGSR
jgi:hypothetical protein